jgi:hypothetical protein
MLFSCGIKNATPQTDSLAGRAILARGEIIFYSAGSRPAR